MSLAQAARLAGTTAITARVYEAARDEVKDPDKRRALDEVYARLENLPLAGAAT